MHEGKKKSGRLQLALIAAVFLGPLLLATWFYIGGDTFWPEGRVNHGALLEPIVHLHDALPDSPLHAKAQGRWLLIFDASGDCREDCRAALHTMRQSRLMLGKEMDRLDRLLLHRDSALDTVFLADEHLGLMTLEEPALSELLKNKKPDELQAGGYFLIDPQGNLVMYFDPGLKPGDMVEDIKRLLKLSRIG